MGSPIEIVKSEDLGIRCEPNRVLDDSSIGFVPELAVAADCNQQKRRHEQPKKHTVSSEMDEQHSEDRTNIEADAETEEDLVQSLFHLSSMQVTEVHEQ